MPESSSGNWEIPAEDTANIHYRPSTGKNKFTEHLLWARNCANLFVFYLLIHTQLFVVGSIMTDKKTEVQGGLVICSRDGASRQKFNFSCVCLWSQPTCCALRCLRGKDLNTARQRQGRLIKGMTHRTLWRKKPPVPSHGFSNTPGLRGAGH